MVDLQKDIDGRLVDISNLANFAMMFVYDPITDKAIPCHISHQVVPVHFIERIKDFAVGKFTGRFLVVHILQLQKDNGIRLIAVFLDEKRDQNPIHLAYDIRIVRIVKNITVRNQRDLPLYTVRFGKLPYLENIFFLNHDKNV